MIMTLRTTKLVTCTIKSRRFCRYLRSTNAKHHTAHSLLLPVEIESKQLRERQDKQPNVKGDTRTRSGPDKCLHISTVTLALSRPRQPKVIDGGALKDDGAQEAEVVDDVEGHGVGKNAADFVVLGEYAKVEENNGCPDKKAGDRVQQHVGVE